MMELTKKVKPEIVDGQELFPLTRGDYGVRMETLHRCVHRNGKWVALEDYIETSASNFGKKFCDLPVDEQEKLWEEGQWLCFDPDFGWM